MKCDSLPSTRDRQRVALFLQFTPTDVISITPTVSYWYDDYYNSTLGLQNAENWSECIEPLMMPTPSTVYDSGVGKCLRRGMRCD